ncbi:DUF1704 domain-containing protein [Candidatus Saccharibacteria bacterium]|nr:DUF1704 domain-containing protein [Candidatus Saccharibacteria bacterium]
MPSHSRLLIPRQPALDQRWFDRLLPLVGAAGEIYEPMLPPPAQLRTLRQQFEAADYDADVNLRVHLQDMERYRIQRSDLESLKYEIAGDEPDELVKEVYIRRIDELILNLDLLLAAAAHDNDTYHAINDTLFGMPDRRLFAAAADWLHFTMTGLSGHDNAAVQKAARHALTLLPQVPPGGPGREALLPDETLFQRVRAVHFQEDGYFDQLLAGVELPAAGEIEREQGDIVVRQILRNLGADFTIGDAVSRYWSMSYETLTILRPEIYSYDVVMFRGVIAHELGSHLLERLNGMRQPLRLLAVGLDGYEMANEGRAYLREQIQFASINEASRQVTWENIILRHFGVSLAMGLDGSKWTFSQLYRLLHALFHAWELSRHPDDKKAAEHYAHDLAWALTIRLLNGTDGRGGAYRKDTCYLMANTGYWRLAAEDVEHIFRGDGGKFNPFDPRHQQWLAELDRRYGVSKSQLGLLRNDALDPAQPQ